MMSCASMVAFMPEPQTLLMVVAPVASGSFAPARGLTRRGLALSGRQHAAHEHFVDPLRRQLGSLQRRADHMGAEPVGAERRQFPHEAAERGAGGGDDDDGGSAAMGGSLDVFYIMIII